MSSNIERLKAATQKVLSMLDDPHPGLSTWQLLFRDKAVELRDLLVEFYPVEPEPYGAEPEPTSRILTPSARAQEIADQEQGAHGATVQIWHVLKVLDEEQLQRQVNFERMHRAHHSVFTK